MINICFFNYLVEKRRIKVLEKKVSSNLQQLKSSMISEPKLHSDNILFSSKWSKIQIFNNNWKKFQQKWTRVFIIMNKFNFCSIFVIFARKLSNENCYDSKNFNCWTNLTASFPAKLALVLMLKTTNINVVFWQITTVETWTFSFQPLIFKYLNLLTLKLAWNPLNLPLIHSQQFQWINHLINFFHVHCLSSFYCFPFTQDT